MRIGILLFSKRPKTESPTCASRLVQEAHALGHESVLFYAPELDVSQPLPPLDVVLCRPNFTEEPSLHTYVVDAFAAADIPMINGSRETLLAKNKLYQHMRLQQASIPQPRFAIADSTDVAASSARQIGYPVVLKIAFGTHGIGVFYAADEQTLRPIADYLSIRDGNPMIIEKFLEGGSDIRAFVIGDRVVAAMQRTAKTGDFRANASQDGACTKVSLSQEEEQLAVRAAKTFGCEIAGVDLMRTPEGSVVLEVNIHPGFLGLEEATGKNIAAEIIRFVAMTHLRQLKNRSV